MTPGFYEKGSKAFFFEKKNQKTFAPLRALVARALPQRGIKVFFASFLFTKKKTLPLAQTQNAH
jgi:hypothetical protein